MIHERAYAKVNLVLEVGRPRRDGLHPLCSLFASIDLADEVSVAEADSDAVHCPGVAGDNLAARAIAAIRRVASDLPPLEVRIDKQIPVAAGLGGGSADAAAVLRAANELAGRPLDAAGLREVAARVGSDVPSQIEPGHALVTGTGEGVEPVPLPAVHLVLIPQPDGLSTRDVYAEHDRLGVGRPSLDPRALRSLAGAGLGDVAAAVHNDLERAALSLRPELEVPLAALRETGALTAAVCGSGPTVFGLFDGAEAAARAASVVPGGMVARTRDRP